MGFPFRTRLRGDEGLVLPRMSDFSTFVCEACTVRAVVDRELSPRASGTALLMLERMRIVDLVSYWSKGTHTQYQGKMKIFRNFAKDFGVCFLRPTPAARPPYSG